jgi:hypothetical protein
MEPDLTFEWRGRRLRTHGDLASAMKACTSEEAAVSLRQAVKAAGWNRESVPWTARRCSWDLVDEDVVAVFTAEPWKVDPQDVIASPS